MGISRNAAAPRAPAGLFVCTQAANRRVYATPLLKPRFVVAWLCPSTQLASPCVLVAGSARSKSRPRPPTLHTAFTRGVCASWSGPWGPAYARQRAFLSLK